MKYKIKKIIVSFFVVGFLFLTTVIPAFAATYTKKINVDVDTGVTKSRIIATATYYTASATRWNIYALHQKLSGIGTASYATQTLQYEKKGNVEKAYQTVQAVSVSSSMSFYSNKMKITWGFDESNVSKGLYQIGLVQDLGK